MEIQGSKDIDHYVPGRKNSVVPQKEAPFGFRREAVAVRAALPSHLETPGPFLAGVGRMNECPGEQAFEADHGLGDGWFRIQSMKVVVVKMSPGGRFRRVADIIATPP